MRTIALNHLPPIQDLQFISDSSGFVLTHTGRLYRFSGNKTFLMETPRDFIISHFHFIDATHGAIAGNAQTVKAAPQQGSFGVVGLLLLLCWVWQNRRGPIRLLAAYASCLIVGCGLLVSCAASWQQYRTADPTSSYTHFLSHNPLSHSAFHHYVGNKGQKSFIAITQDEGSHWQTHEVPSNFFVTALTALGQNFFVGTYAREEAGVIPMHADGDVWIYGSDPTLTPQLAANLAEHPYGLRASRGIKGFFISQRDSALYMYGSDRMPTIPSSVLSATNGNIYALPITLKPKGKLIDVPDTVDVHSLAQSETGELWVSLDNRKPYLSKGALKHTILPTKRLLRFHAGRWVPVSVAPGASVRQVAFVPNTPMGYALTESGNVFETRDHGETWHDSGQQGVRRMQPRPHVITWLQADNQLVVYQPEIKK